MFFGSVPYGSVDSTSYMYVTTSSKYVISMNVTNQNFTIVYIGSNDYMYSVQISGI